MGEFDLGKLIRFVVIAFALIFMLRACSAVTYGPGYGGGGFFSGLLLGQMMGGGIFSGQRYDDRYGKNVRRGSLGSGSGRSRSGGFGRGK